ncbi:MAG TPA: hypothetical protein VEY09_10225 [Pyrinomonadaceae bacterium]|nr:hypothetical protein [Pyrinomonadaceae bacterium]
MLSNSSKLLLAVAAALLLASAPPAQCQQPAAEAEERYVTQKGFGNRVFEVKHREPANLAQVLRTLGSGFRGAAVTPNQEFRTITVRDFPENISAMEETLRRLDTPEGPRRGVEFQVYLLAASNDAPLANNIPAELGDAVGRLRQSLGYRNFSLMGSQMVRSRDGRHETFNKGVAELRLAGDTPTGRSPVHYNYYIRAVSLGGGTGPANVQVEEFSLEIRVPVTGTPDNRNFDTVAFKNPVSLREGERVVVGTTSVGDKSVVVILSANATRQ